MFLDKIVSVDGRFQRSINSDIGDLDFFQGYKAPSSSEKLLYEMSEHVMKHHIVHSLGQVLTEVESLAL